MPIKKKDIYIYKVKKIIIILLVLIIFNSAVNAEKEIDNGLINDELDKVTIQLKWFHQFQFAGYYAAIEKGFYAEEGLDVELRQRVAGTSHLNDVLQGRAQYGVADAGGLLIERLQGKPVVLLAQIFQHSPLVLVSREDSGIRVARDLAGKRVTIDVVGHSEMPFFALLSNTFGKLDAVKIQPHRFNPQDLIDGKTDAYGSYLTNHPDWFRQQGVAVNIINPRDYGIDFYGDNLFTTEEELNERPDRVEKIRRATLKGWRYTLDNRDEMIDLILEKYNTQGTDRDHLAYEARETEKLILPYLIEVRSFILGRYQDIADTYARAGFVQQATLDPGFFYQAEATPQQIKLSAGEQAWIAEHPKITLGYTTEIEPLIIAGDDGQLSGILIDIYDELESRTGIKINIEVDEWSSTIQKAKDGKIDGLLVSASSLAGNTGLIHTHILATGFPTIFAKKDAPFEINSEEDLKGKKVSVLKGVYVVEQALKPYEGAIEIVETESALEMMKMVLEGKVDAAYGLSYHNYLIGKYMLIGIEPVYFSHKLDANGVASIRADWPEFVSIMNKVLDVIGKDGLNEINRKWTQLESEPGFQKQMQSLVSKEVDHLFSALSDRLRSNINDLLSSNRDGIPRSQDEHLVMVKHLSSSYPFLQSVNYIDASNRIQYVSPVESNQKVIGLKIDIPAPLAALQSALASGQSALSAPFEIIQGRMGYSLMTVHPHKGALEQVFRAEAIFGPNSSFRQQSGIALRVSDGGKIVYTTPDFSSDGRLMVLATGEIMGRHFQIEAITSTILPLMLSEEERRWLWEHPEATLGTDQGWQPYVVVEKDGSISGIEADLIERINALTGANIRIVVGKWSEMVTKARARQIDGLAASAYHKEREPHFLFTDSTYSVSKYIYARSTKIKSMEDLVGKRVALLRGNRAEEDLLKRQLGIILVPADSNDEMVSLLGGGQVDAVIGGINFRMDAQEKMIFDIKIAFIIPDSETEMIYSIRNDWPELKSIINKALVAIPLVERLEIMEKWVQPGSPGKDILSIKHLLTGEEKAWLYEHPVLLWGYDVGWPPLEWLTEKGEVIGIAADYMTQIEKILGVRIEPVEPRSWSAMMDAARAGELDIMSAIVRRAPRDEFLDFTEPYLHFAMVIVTRQDVPYIGDMRELHGKTVGVGEDYASHDFLRSNHPEIILTPSRDVREGLLSVIEGETFAFVGNLAIIYHIIAREGLDNLKVSGETPYAYDLSIGVRKGETHLLSAMQKALDAISEEERAEIYRKWFSVTVEHKFDYTMLWQILAVVAIVLVLFFYWNRRLSREVSTRQMAEIALQKAKEVAETANLAKSAFLANMSHELRTPLTAILGFSQLLQLEPEITPGQKESLGIINRGGEHLLELINDVLELSKIEAGEATLNEKSFDLYAFLRDISEMFHSQAVEKKLFFTLEKDVGLPRYIKGDEGKLRQVLINLFGNALKFTETGGVTLRVRSGDAEENILALHFEVKDTGIGIDSDRLEKIFNPFIHTQGSADRTTGTGLGLTISRKFINLMRGSIEVESKPDSGSLFRFEVAVARAEASDIEDTSHARRVIGLAPGQPSFRILVVEDMMENRKLLTRLLKSVGFEVRDASDGKQGVETFNSWHPDLIWMDMRMPVMDGYEATKEIKKTEAGRKAVIIALTAHAFEEQRQEILNIGCDDLIGKPYNQEELFAAMEKHLGIEFIYEDQDISLMDLQKRPEDILTPETLVELPEKIKSDLLKVTAQLDQRGCFAILDQLYVTNKEVASALRILVENYQFEEFEKVLGQKCDIGIE